MPSTTWRVYQWLRGRGKAGASTAEIADALELSERRAQRALQQIRSYGGLRCEKLIRLAANGERRRISRYWTVKPTKPIKPDSGIGKAKTPAQQLSDEEEDARARREYERRRPMPECELAIIFGLVPK